MACGCGLRAGSQKAKRELGNEGGTQGMEKMAVDGRLPFWRFLGRTPKKSFFQRPKKPKKSAGQVGSDPISSSSTGR